MSEEIAERAALGAGPPHQEIVKIAARTLRIDSVLDGDGREYREQIVGWTEFEAALRAIDGRGTATPPEPNDPRALRCKTTGNPCGTDTWAIGAPCLCASCREWLAWFESLANWRERIRSPIIGGTATP